MADELTMLLNSFGIPFDVFIVLLLFVLLVVGGIIVVIISRPILDIYPYLLTTAKVRARKGRLFDEKQLSEIVETNDIEEITNYLRGFPDYEKYVDKYPLEKLFDVHLAETYDLISTIAPKNVKKVFTLLSKNADITNIKSVLSAKNANLSRDETLDLLLPIGNLYEGVEDLVEANTVEDVVAGLSDTEYASILEDNLDQYRNSNMVLPLEAALDKYYYENLLLASNYSGDDNDLLLHSYIGSIVDVSNIKIIIRAKVDNLNYDDISPYLTKTGYQIKEWKLKDLMESENVSSIINSLEGTDYAPVLNEAITTYKNSSSAVVFENALDEYIMEYAKSLSLRKPLGIGPMIGFLSEKEKEIKNLKIIVRAKREPNFPISNIQEMLL